MLRDPPAIFSSSGPVLRLISCLLIFDFCIAVMFAMRGWRRFAVALQIALAAAIAWVCVSVLGVVCAWFVMVVVWVMVLVFPHPMIVMLVIVRVMATSWGTLRVVVFLRTCFLLCSFGVFPEGWFDAREDKTTAFHCKCRGLLFYGLFTDC